MPVHLKRISATSMIVKGLDPFNILRIPCASDALDTLLEVYVKEGVCSYLCPRRVIKFILILLDLKGMGNVLKLTLPTLVAYGAIQWMGGKDKLHHHLPEFPEFWCIGPHHHSILSRDMAGGHRLPLPFHLHHADPASTDWGQPFIGAKCRYIDTRRPRSIKDRCIGIYLYFYIVYG